MAKKSWRRDPHTGLPIGRDPTTEIPLDRLPEEYLTDAGDFDRSAFPGPSCDLFNLWAILGAIATVARFPNVYDFKRRVLAPCSSYFHLHQIVDDDGKVLGYVTRTNSAQEGARIYRAAKRARQLAGKRVTDVSGGSGTNLAGSSQVIDRDARADRGAGKRGRSRDTPGVASIRAPL